MAENTTPKTDAIATEIQKLLDKPCRRRAPRHYEADQRFKPVKFIPSMNFGTKQGGIQPAVVIVRIDKRGLSKHPARKFLDEFELALAP